MFGKNNRLWRNRHAAFGSVIRIVQTDGNKFLAARHASANARLAPHQRQLFNIDLAQFGQRLWRDGFAGNIAHVFGEIADAAFLIENAWLFFSQFAVAQKFHVSIPLLCRLMPARFISSL
jgi:hypothetical protein